MVRLYLKEIRIKSWVKNLFVFCPMVFSSELLEKEKFLEAIVLTFGFCLISSAVYIFNDINDAENDRKHAEKKERPIASGEISVKKAAVLTVILALLGLGIGFYVNKPAFLYMLAYIFINILYSKWLKRKAIVDCFCIAAGFVLRVMAGGTIVTLGVSNWMFLTVLGMALFMAFGKRRGELCTYSGGETRNVLDVYDMNFLNGIVFMCAGLTVMFYSLWSISQKPRLIYSVPVVVFMVARYLLLVFKGRADADPTTLLFSDKALLIACLACGILVLTLLYV